MKVLRYNLIPFSDVLPWVAESRLQSPGTEPAALRLGEVWCTPHLKQPPRGSSADFSIPVIVWSNMRKR